MLPPDMGAGERLRRWVPRWWQGEAGGTGAALNGLLWPVEQAYRVTVSLRSAAYDAVLPVHEAPIPVLSVGNIAVGGAGKTPFSAWLAGRLLAGGRRPAIVLRGYGADEILVHRELNPAIPVFAAAQRIEAVQSAAQAGCDVAVLDDGFQHRRLHRQLDLVLVAAESWTLRPRLLPRGPWREGLGALDRAGVVVVTRKTASAERAAQVVREVTPFAPEAIPIIARLIADHLSPLHPQGGAMSLRDLRGREVLAVATLADPRPFAEHLSRAGAAVELLAYGDHHEFTAAQVRDISERAGTRPVVMTRKEAVKLRPLLDADLAGYVLEQRVEIESGLNQLMRAVQTAVAR
jgi:tetraacyldisaccharide 4'-kinase